MELTPCTLGAPAMGTDADVFDDQGNPVRNEVGHLVLKQPIPSLTMGFLNDSDRYLETYFSRWNNIWYHGDWAKVDKEGFWYLFGRSDDTIKVSGKRVGPNEIESITVNPSGLNNEISSPSVLNLKLVCSDPWNSSSSHHISKNPPGGIMLIVSGNCH